jgi:hypothetical protein
MSCCKKKLIISEDEKKNILGLYGLMVEQTTEKKTKTKDISGESFFAPGFYSKIDPKAEKQLEAQLDDAIDFINKNRGKSTSIKIFASEDKTQNWDRENDPSGQNPKYKLPSGELAKRRAEGMKNFLTNYFQKAVEMKRLSVSPTFEQAEVIIGKGTTPEQMKQDRRVTVRFSVTGSDFDCLNGLQIILSYDPVAMKNTSASGHSCNNAVYEMTINGKPLLRIDGKPYASLNNLGVLENPRAMGKFEGSDGKEGGRRSNVFIVDEKLAEELLKPDSSGNTPDKFEISLTCRNADYYKGPSMVHKKWGRGCHVGAGRMYFKNGLEAGKFEFVDKETPVGENETRIFTTINACGFVLQ